MSKPARVILLAATALTSIQAAQASFTSELYVGGYTSLYTVQGTTITETRNNSAYIYYNTVHVFGDVRTMDVLGNQYSGGELFPLAGPASGTLYASDPMFVQSYDGTSDGTYNYTVNYYGSVIRSGRDFSNPTSIFDSGFGNLGITYQASNNSLWISDVFNTLRNFTLDGQLISSYTLSHSFNMGLAFDPADNTLWMLSGVDFNYRQYNLAGQLLDTFSMTSIFGSTSYLYSAEFNLGGSGGCPVGAGNDTCLIDSTTSQVTAINAVGGTDTLQVGGADDFGFDVASIGTTYTNFETFQKVGASNVSLTGAAGAAANWDVLAGTLTASTGDNISNASHVAVSNAATFALTASETIGSLSGPSGSFVNLNSNTLTTGGGNLSYVFAGNISGTGGLTKIGTGNQTLAGTNSYTGPTLISGGTLTAGGGNAIADTGAVTVNAPAQLTITSSETIGSLAGSGAVDFSVNTLTTGGANTSTTFTGTTSGSGGFTKVGSGVFSTLSLANTGTNTIGAGEMNINGNVAGSIVVNSGAALSGNASIAGSLTLNAGGFLKSGNSPGTTIVGGNLTGGGTILTEVQFNNAGAPVNGTTHDFLSVGGAASGTTLLNVVPFAPSGSPAATTGNGIELVRVGGATSASQFALAAPVLLGPYQYVLSYVPTAGADSYFLQSRIGEGLLGDAALAVAGKSLVANCFRSADEGAGNGNQSTVGRGWAKVSGGNVSTGADTGLETEQDYTCGSGGIDVRVTDGVRVGVSGGYANTDVDVATSAGTAKLEGDGGVMSSFVGYTSGNMFANLSVGYGKINWDYQGPLTAARSATTSGMIGALQAGMLWPMGDWRLGATAELAYDALECGNQCLLAGTQDDVASWTAKAGLRLDGTMHEGKILPFLSVAFSDSLDGASSVFNAGATVESEIQSSLLNARAGLTAMVSENMAVFLSGGLTEGRSNGRSGAEGTIGAKLHW